MLNHFMLPTISLTAVASLVLWPLKAPAIMRPLSSSNYASIQFVDGQFRGDGAEAINGLMLTGCSQLGGEGPQVCLQWLGDDLTTCLEWGSGAIVTACMQRSDDSEDDDKARHTSGDDWGFSLELTIQ